MYLHSSPQRYARATQVLYGAESDVAARFSATEEDMGILLLNKIWEIYQDYALISLVSAVLIRKNHFLAEGHTMYMYTSSLSDYESAMHISSSSTIHTQCCLMYL